jgi:hypothetical protein
MIYIAHRGNINGPNPNKENHPDYLLEAVKAGYDAEVDVWYVDGKFLLGHDSPQYEVDKSFLLNERFWHHAKNIKAFYHLNRMQPIYFINCFFHDIDAAVLTSGGWIWTYPGQELTPDSIAVMPEMVPGWNVQIAYGICSDYVLEYRKDINFHISMLGI